ncbi:phage scaffolding protein [Caproicibacterium sp. BJN0003]|uniref:phage scaffolding protein n=1 Tax=Caproicibacterium sp. BJN0003 TaxID=2994078 RepID=UPI0022552B82|nr:phage scaffolding protein [Caproicibacterium sp. BJN0003]UZT82643.1 phage scaffolding protein [Caproicibacterium sp. BJN0003]
MKTEELTSIGLTDEQASQVMVLHGKDITKLQNSVGTLTTERDNYKTQLDTANGKLTGYDPEWKTKSDTAAENAQKQVDALKFDYALSDALKSAKAKDVTGVKAHLKTDALKLDGDTILGLKEQLDNVKNDYGFLFESDEKPPQFSARTPGPNTGTLTDHEKANAALREALGGGKE